MSIIVDHRDRFDAVAAAVRDVTRLLVYPRVSGKLNFASPSAFAALMHVLTEHVTKQVAAEHREHHQKQRH